MNKRRRQKGNTRKTNAPSMNLEKIKNSTPVLYFKSFWQKLPKLHQKILSILVPVLLVIWILPLGSSEQVSEEVVLEPPQDSSQTRVAIGLDIPGVEKEPVASAKDKPARVSLNPEQEQALEEKEDTTAGPKPWTEYVVQAGDNLSSIFRRYDLDPHELNALLKVEGKGKPLTQLAVGQTVRFRKTNRGYLDILQLRSAQGEVMYFRLSSGGFARGD